ncbi:5-formyltetrahydrofolate cyclo-ligase [Natranaerobius trueperi]|uniref:5-formyltetrahydrofolate cyclo-ligase n=1 Tax=Natranaerobius trueperi TaxID=759412 RepID=A0A226C0Q7_9FIRM|nr:5-formyltetrahydrofolate cyclo-ligase [Natranaerobius trueperi]OWZ84765.1 5-formyltetrahydrofolate cyclo-ligase [Natranaerobius trueperi]
MIDKSLIRKELINKRKKMPENLRTKYSHEITKKFFQNFVDKKVTSIMTYLPIKSEVDTYQLIEKAINNNINVYVPRTDPKNKTMKPIKITNLKTDLQLGVYNIYEPKAELSETINSKSIDKIIVPGVAFDLLGYRIGYGGGYYDKFIDNLASYSECIAVAYEFQIKDKLPRDSWDKPVDAIITEKEVRFIKV